MPFKTINVPNDKNLQLIQANVTQALQPLFNSPLVYGSTHTGVSVGTSATTIAHGLGNMPTAWVMTDITANATVHRVSWDATNITLIASAPCTISFWIR